MASPYRVAAAWGFAALLGPCGMLVGTACGDACETLAEDCARCTDADFKENCEQTVAEGVQGVCQSRQAVYADLCPEVDAELATSSATSSTTTGAGGTTTTATTTTTTTTTDPAAGGGGSGGNGGAGGA
ncbi:MAG: hypothetical protein AAGA56_01680 [Myxococcota bacterium]